LRSDYLMRWDIGRESASHDGEEQSADNDGPGQTGSHAAIVTRKAKVPRGKRCGYRECAASVV
jgi:hypothetical protein